MRATAAYVRERFAYFNNLCFGGALPEIPVRMSNAKSFLGQLKFKRRRKLFGKDELYDFTLHISTRFDLPADTVDDTIIHEMIHYYIHYNGITDTAPHGSVFRRIMTTVNTNHGRHIAVRHTSNSAELATDSHVKSHFICVTKLDDGTRCLTVCARTRIFEIYRILSGWDKVRSMEWYFSKDSHFNRFPVSKTAKLYRMDADTEVCIKNARRLECDGHRLYLKE